MATWILWVDAPKVDLISYLLSIELLIVLNNILGIIVAGVWDLTTLKIIKTILVFGEIGKIGCYDCKL